MSVNTWRSVNTFATSSLINIEAKTAQYTYSAVNANIQLDSGLLVTTYKAAFAGDNVKAVFAQDDIKARFQ